MIYIGSTDGPIKIRYDKGHMKTDEDNVLFHDYLRNVSTNNTIELLKTIMYHDKKELIALEKFYIGQIPSDDCWNINFVVKEKKKSKTMKSQKIISTRAQIMTKFNLDLEEYDKDFRGHINIQQLTLEKVRIKTTEGKWITRSTNKTGLKDTLIKLLELIK
jgi:hypothetical protein